MRRLLAFALHGAILVGLLSQSTLSTAQNPVEINGQLQLVGNQLSNECGAAVQLRGISTHGPQWFEQCYTTSSLTSIRDHWGADIFRIAMYTEHDGYLSDPLRWAGFINDMVDECEALGIYVIIDWHILSDNDPWDNIEQARFFWDYMAETHAGKKHVLYEICNEPNGDDVDWARVKSYAEDIIPRIRAHDPDNIIIVGTPRWSQKVDDASADPLTGDNAHNVMYTFHFYAGSHGYLKDRVKTALTQIPIFCTEWGTPSASGGGSVNATETQNYMDIFNGDNPFGITVSWCNWSFADKNESSALLNPGSCGSGNWTNKTASGDIVYNHLNNPADSFQECGDNTIEEVSQRKLNMFPNPVVESVRFASFSGEFQLLDALGKQVMTGNVQSGDQIQVGHLKPGIYTVKTSEGVGRLIHH